MPQEIRRRDKEDKIASYTYTDLLTGKTYIHYYAGKGTANNILTGFIYYSTDVSTTVSPVTLQTFDYDSPVTSTFVVDGSAIISCTVKKEAKSAPSSACIISGSILRVRKGTETDMGIIRLANKTTAAEADDYRISDKLDLTKTRFKSGDTLRLRITMHVTGNNDDYSLYHDPKNRQGGLTDTVPGSTLDAYIPFNVNV